MAARGPVYGLDAELAAKRNAKYSSANENEAREFIKAMTGTNISSGPNNVHLALKDGSVLVNLVNKMKPGVCKGKPSSMPFKQMENIGNFLAAAQTLGVPANNLFQTVDLFEEQNMSQVIVTILCLKNLSQGKGILVSHAADPVKSDPTAISLQYGSNKGANQSGMTFGQRRHIATHGNVDYNVDKNISSAPTSNGKFCSECGNLRQGNSKFCSECGTSF